MTSPRPSRTLYIVLAALLVLLPLLAILQYGWIGQVNQAERRHLEEDLNQSGMRFTSDFDREITRILNTFQVRGTPEREDIADWFAQRYDDSTATYPSLVQRVFLARRSNSDIELLQFDPLSRSLEPVEWPTEFAELKQTIEARLDRSGRQRGGPPRGTSISGAPVFIVPGISDLPRSPFGTRNAFDPRNSFVRGSRGGRPSGSNPGNGTNAGMGPGPAPLLGFSVVELNPKILYEDFIPSIVSRHFPSGANAEYRVAIVSGGQNHRIIYRSEPGFSETEMQRPDLRLPLFNPEPGIRPRPSASAQQQDFQQRGTNRPGFTGLPGPGAGFAGGMRGLSLAGNWELLVKHRSGSLDAAIASVRNRDLAVAFGILLMLALSVVLAVVSSHRARALAQLQMDFVARVSHELRTPLAIIRSAAYNLATGVVADEQGVREYAAMVQNEGQRLSAMVDQILAFSRTESGREAYDLRAVEVDQIVERAMSNMSASLAAASCAVDRSIAPDLPRVRADERAFTECLQNLLANAIKYGCCESAPRIKVEARRDGGNTVIVSVADSGPGIDGEDLNHIFDPFFRGKNAGSDTPGSGLGLNLVRRMMSAQGGRVTVESEPGRGTRFSLHLSVISEAAS
jgi:signal transduction histidine kinase